MSLPPYDELELRQVADRVYRNPEKLDEFIEAAAKGAGNYRDEDGNLMHVNEVWANFLLALIRIKQLNEEINILLYQRSLLPDTIH